MPPKAARLSLAEAVRTCRNTANGVIDAAKNARLFVEDCKGLAGYAKRIVPLLDDLEDNVPDAGGEDTGVRAVQDLDAALARAAAAVAACSSMGPFYALMNEATVMGEFVNAAADMHAALKGVNVKALKVDAAQAEALGLVMQQLQRLTVSYTPCNATAQMLVELRNEAEAVRTGRPDAKAFPHSDLSQRFLKDCTVSQLVSDVAYLRSELAAAQAARKHVEAHFLSQLLSMEEPLLPKDEKTARQLADKVVVPAAAPRQAAPEPPASVDPVPIVQDLLSKLVNSSLPLEQRAAALRPLVAAAGLDPEGMTSSQLHGGAVLYALTDPECAQKVVSLVNEPTTDPLIKGWLLALVLSLVHPEQGLNPDTQAALMRTGLPAALCRLMVSPTTPSEQRLQAMAMLRVMIHDPATHTLMVEAKVIHALVQQVGDVKVVKGQVVATKGAPTSVPATAAFDVDAQITELAVLMLHDMAPGVFKADVLKTGGVMALSQRLADPSTHERVRAAAAGALSVLMQDGAIAVEAARANALVGLLSMLSTKSPAMQGAAKAALTQMLTPTPAMSKGTADFVLAAANAPVVSLPPQGKQAKLAARSVAAEEVPSVGTKASRSAAAAAPQAPAKSQEQLASELFVEMGRAIGPQSTTALMDMVQKDDAEVLPLVLQLLPLTATDPSCRAAIIGHTGGMPVLLREAGKKEPGALAALRAVAQDLKLRSSTAAALSSALVAAGQGTPAAANLALAIAMVGSLPPGSEKDKAAASSVAAFASEVHAAGAIPHLVALARTTDPLTKSCGVLALRPMAVYGDTAVKASIVSSDALVALVDAVKATDVKPIADGIMPLSQAASDALAGLGAGNAATQATIFASLTGNLSSESTAPTACAAMMAVAGTSAESHGLLIKAGVVPKLVALLDKGGDGVLAPVARLLAQMVMYASDAADAAAMADAGKVLPAVLQRGDADARAAAAAAAGYVMKRGEKSINQFADHKGLGLLLDTVKGVALDSPYWEDACHALATLASQHEGSRGDTSRTVRGWLLRGGVQEATSGARTCAWLSYSPKGREILFTDELIDSLVKQLSAAGAPDAQRWAADALVHAASAGSVSLTLPLGAPAGTTPTTINPKPMIVNKGAVDPLVQMLRSDVERVAYEAAFALECLCSTEEGLAAAKRARAKDVLNDIVQRGKKNEVSERLAKAAHSAYMKVL